MTRPIYVAIDTPDLARAKALAQHDPYISDSFGWALFKMGDLKAARRLVESSRKELQPLTEKIAATLDFDSMIDVFRAGANGYIVKDIECQSLIESLKLVALGETVLPSQLVKHLPLRSAMANSNLNDGSELLESLSERELETLRCLIMGYPNKVIAYRLDISEATVKVHVKAILRKLGVQNRTQAAIWAVNNGLDANAACATLAAEFSHEKVEDDDYV